MAIDEPITVSARPPRPTGERYERIDLIGQGAMGEVHLARDPVLNRVVAVKQLDPDLAGYEDLRRRFITEAQITAQLDHPSIVAVHELEVPDREAPRFAMRLVRGQTLRAYLDDARAQLSAGALDHGHALPSRLELFLHVCDAVAYAHSKRVIHRDLKPENIMVGPFREVQVMDWGLARVMGGAEPLHPHESPRARKGLNQTLHGLVVGTPRYMSPEQAEGRNDELDGRSDTYSLGIILSELASLRAPPLRAGLALTADGILGPALPSPEEDEVPTEPIPPDLQAIIDKATASDRDDRYAGAEALAEDVRRFLRDEEVSARPDTPRQRLLRWVGRHRQHMVTLVLALALLVVFVAAIGVMGAWTVREVVRQEAARREAQLGALSAIVTEQADAIDNQLLRFQGLLQGLAFAAEEALVREPAPGQRWYTAEDFASDAPPPDLVHSAVYDDHASFDWPDLVAAPDVSLNQAQRRLAQLASLRDALRRVQLRSHSEAALNLPRPAQRALLLDEGAPVIWTYVATEDGFLAGYPGTGDYPDAYDPRTRPWYQLTVATRGPVWSAADADESGMGLLVTASTALVDESGALLGVAALDVPFDWLIDTYLDAPALEGRGEAFLVDAAGRTMVRSSQRDVAREVHDYAPEPFPWPEALQRAGDRRTGLLELDDGQLLVWRRLEAVDWRYIVVGPSAQLLR